MTQFYSMKAADNGDDAPVRLSIMASGLSPRRPARRRKANVKDPSGLTIRGADMSRAEPFKWAWDQRILLGYLNLTMGEEKIGKGNLAAWVAARITRGELPGDLAGEPSLVAFVGDEDSWDGVWTPRLKAAGADLDLCKHIVEGTDGVFDVTRADDIAALGAYVQSSGVALVYFDQLLDNLGDTDSWKDKQVRNALAPLRQCAAQTESAMMMSLHPNKRQGSFRQRLSGTPAFNALSRSSMLVAEHPLDSGRRVAVRATGNYSEEPPGFEFRIQQVTVKGKRNQPIVTSRIVDEGDTYEVRYRDVLDASIARGRGLGGQVGHARTLLEEILADGQSHDVKDVFAQLAEHGIPSHIAQRASSALGVIKLRTNEFPARSMWKLRR
jgi:hypothetical protein